MKDLIIGFTNGGLAQLARAPALHAGGHRFDSDILHKAISWDNYFSSLLQGIVTDLIISFDSP
jgi:hypothetical protein